MRKSVYIASFLSFIVLFWGYTGSGQIPTTTTVDTSGPQSYAMIMGISTYKYIRPLSYADKDAELLRDFLKSPAGGKLRDENIYCLLNEDAIAAKFWVK